MSKCKICKRFQELVSPDYLCKQCGKRALEDVLINLFYVAGRGEK